MRHTLIAHRVRILEFEYSGQWPKESVECLAQGDRCVTRRRTLGRTLRWMWEEAYGRAAQTHAALRRIGGRWARNRLDSGPALR